MSPPAKPPVTSNRRIALNIVRRFQPCRGPSSPAVRPAAQHVSAIVAQLIAEGWVTEGASPVSGRGRRPRFLHLNVERAGIVAVDLRQARRGRAGGLDARFLMQTDGPRQPRPGVRRRGGPHRGVVQGQPSGIVYEGMGVSCRAASTARAGSSSRRTCTGRGNGSQAASREAVGLPVALENAASACALANSGSDAGRHGAALVAVTVSEGVGVGLLVNGQVVHGRGAMAGEFGHITLDETGRVRLREEGVLGAVRLQPGPVRHYKELSRGSAGDAEPADARLGIGDILRLADEGCPHAAAALTRLAHYLGVGLASLVIGWRRRWSSLSARFTAAWDRIGPVVLDTSSGARSPRTRPRLCRPTGHQPRLRGPSRWSCSITSAHRTSPDDPVDARPPRPRGCRGRAFAPGASRPRGKTAEQSDGSRRVFGVPSRRFGRERLRDRRAGLPRKRPFDVKQLSLFPLFFG